MAGKGFGFFTKDKKVRPMFFGKNQPPSHRVTSKVLPKKPSVFGEKASHYGKRSVGFVQKRLAKHKEKKAQKLQEQQLKKDTAIRNILSENPTWSKEQALQELRKNNKKSKKFKFGEGEGGDFENPMRAGEVFGGEEIGDTIQINSKERIVGHNKEAGTAFTNFDREVDDDPSFWKESVKREKKVKQEKKNKEEASAKADRIEMMLLSTPSGRDLLGIKL